MSPIMDANGLPCRLLSSLAADKKVFPELVVVLEDGEDEAPAAAATARGDDRVSGGRLEEGKAWTVEWRDPTELLPVVRRRRVRPAVVDATAV